MRYFGCNKCVSEHLTLRRQVYYVFAVDMLVRGGRARKLIFRLE